MSNSSIKPSGYMRRIVDDQVEKYLDLFGAVEIAGTKWCGKTWTAREHGASISYVDVEYSLAKDDPSLMLQGATPHIIDEWQRVPEIWNLVRHEVDESRSVRGKWILTGSSTPESPENSSQEIRHSGAGRFGRIHMAPMSLSESGDSSRNVSLAQLFEAPPEQSIVENDTQQLIDIACRGGWPEAVDSNPKDAQLIAREYLAAISHDSAPKYGLDPFLTEQIIASIARSLGQAATYKTIKKDAIGVGASEISDREIAKYISFFKRLFLINEIPGWEPPSRSKKRLQVKPKRYFADPSLPVAALGMSPAAFMEDWQTFGFVFENLCMRDLEVYARAHELSRPVPLRYYRDDSGLEVDAIFELVDGRWAAFEIKTSETKTNEAVSNLKRFRKKICENPKAKTRSPEFMAVIVGIGKYVRVVEEGIYVIPIRALTS